MVELQRRRTFRQYTYRGIELETLLGYTDKQLKVIFPSRQRRKMIRGGGQKKAKLLIEKLRTKASHAPVLAVPHECPTTLLLRVRGVDCEYFISLMIVWSKFVACIFDYARWT
eukprot:Lankesteria_metandrocarpae@DN2860_c0_g1_i1.p1